MNYTVTEGNYLRFGLQSVKDGVILPLQERKKMCVQSYYMTDP